MLACTLLITGPIAGTQAFFLDDAAPALAASVFVASNTVGVLYAIRAVRLRVTVTDRWIEQRGLFVTRVVPWRSVRAVSANAGGRFTIYADRDWILRQPRIRTSGSPPFELLLADLPARCLPAATRTTGQAGAPEGPRMVPVAIAALGVWGGLLAIAATTADIALYAERATRSASTVADVLDWEVSRPDGESGHEPEATVRFTSETGVVTTPSSAAASTTSGRS